MASGEAARAGPGRPRAEAAALPRLAGGCDPALRLARDAGDESVSDELKEQEFTEVELDSTTLNEVREALKRIDDGTFGRCVVDGEPIDEKRLEAMPWTPYCLKHQQLREAGRRTTATL